MKKIKITSIGSGWVVTNRHLPALHNNQKFEIVAIVGPQKEKLESLVKKYRIPRYFIGDATKNCGWLDLCDAVMIGTDPLSHYRLVKFCLENAKHVLLEKPLTTSIKESEELVSIAQKKKINFGIVHNFQFSRSAQKLDKDLTEKKLGEIKGLYAFQFGNPKRRLPIWYEKLPWGLFFDESPHLIYLLDKYGKGISLVNSTKFNSTRGLNTPSLVTANFKTNIGIPAFLYLNFESPLSEWYLIAIGEKKLGIVDIFRDIYFSLPNDGVHNPLDVLRTSKSAIFGHLIGAFLSGLKVINKKYLCGNEKIVDIFANSILKKVPLSPIDVEDALRINKIQFEIINNAQEVSL